MATVAEHLRAAREAKKLSIAQVAEVTKIRTDHLRALEEGNYTVFAAPVYIRGFVRSYSTFLKMDVPVVMAALDSELGRSEKFATQPPLTKEPRGAMDFVTLQLSKLNWRRAVVILGALLVVILFFSVIIAWAHHKKSDPLNGLKPGIYQPAKDSGDTLTLPPPKPTR
ncbi:MAG TPA: helix-turn-helix domain-containing protein [Verrucomicrobiae bacterium]|jgi:cytoskeletal protein RodZ|nr:helix-turn-helix domain-containing protein [Verrucomicrobiae bacterium]